MTDFTGKSVLLTGAAGGIGQAMAEAFAQSGARVALVDPEALGLGVTVMVHVRTNDHSAAWLDRFAAAIEDLPEIIEAYRISGEIDYTLKVVVPSIDAYDDFYRRLIGKVDLYDVRSVFVMEEIKRTTALPLHFLPGTGS